MQRARVDGNEISLPDGLELMAELLESVGAGARTSRRTARPVARAEA